MKYLDSILSFIISLAGVVFHPRRRRKPPCCPCPYPEEKEEIVCPYEQKEMQEGQEEVI